MLIPQTKTKMRYYIRITLVNRKMRANVKNGIPINFWRSWQKWACIPAKWLTARDCSAIGTRPGANSRRCETKLCLLWRAWYTISLSDVKITRIRLQIILVLMVRDLMDIPAKWPGGLRHICREYFSPIFYIGEQQKRCNVMKFDYDRRCLILPRWLNILPGISPVGFIFTGVEASA